MTPVIPNLYETVLNPWLHSVDQDRYLRIDANAVPHENCISSSLNGDTGRQPWLSVNLPSREFCTNPWGNELIFWFPRGLVPQPSVALVSSRLGKQPDTKPAIFSAIRTTARSHQKRRSVWVTHHGTTLHPFLQRSAELFDVPLLEFKPMPPDVDSAWFRHESERTDAGDRCFYDVWRSRVLPTPRPNALYPDHIADTLLITVAHEVRVLSVRNHGRVFAAVQRRLEHLGPDHRTKLLTGGHVSSRRASDALCAKQIHAWWLYQDVTPMALPPRYRAPSKPAMCELKQLQQNLVLSDYLSHWTRRRHGPWPGQSEQLYLDALILDRPDAEHGPIAALERILTSGQLLATTRLTRDKPPVVCFSQQTVDQFPKLRTFRRHLQRWDFEQVGIAIKRQWLENIGARRVIYGSELDWKDLDEERRPFFQINHPDNVADRIDWSIEREWRVVGDVNLTEIRPCDAFFVPTKDDAQRVAPFSRWPVAYFGS